MKKIAIFILVFTTMATFVWAKGSREAVPKVRYIAPMNDSVVDLKGRNSLTFKWRAPLPSGGRQTFKFNIYKGFGYEVVVREMLDPKVFSIEIPADKFENGALYTWQVKQRAMRHRFWSMDHRWSFRVKK